MNLTKQLNPNCVIRIFKSNLHLTQQVAAGKLWRQKNSLPKLQTARGPLIDLPDFSFLGLYDTFNKKVIKSILL